LVVTSGIGKASANDEEHDEEEEEEEEEESDEHSVSETTVICAFCLGVPPLDPEPEPELALDGFFLPTCIASQLMD
jgi:hypothetical protein